MTVSLLKVCSHSECDYLDACRYVDDMSFREDTLEAPRARVIPLLENPERVLPSFDMPKVRFQATRDMLTSAYVLSRTYGSEAVTEAALEILHLGTKSKPRAKVIAYVTLLLGSDDAEVVAYGRWVLFGQAVCR